MPEFGPISRRNLLKYLKKAGFHGPYPGGKHQFMIRGDDRLRIPNPHKSDIGKNLLMRLLTEANIKRDDWEQL
jgi:predicted RNA binding protein YcfA (HicA-like mRNA interferase family)